MSNVGSTSLSFVTSTPDQVLGKPSILLLAAEPAASEAAAALEAQLAATVEVAPDRNEGERRLRSGQFSVVVLEASLTGIDAEAAEVLHRLAGGALVVEVNFALANAPRIAQQVRLARHQRELQEIEARGAVTVQVKEQLNASLTGLLLESQLALRQVDPALVPALERVVGLAEHLCEQLKVS